MVDPPLKIFLGVGGFLMFMVLCTTGQNFMLRSRCEIFLGYPVALLDQFSILGLYMLKSADYFLVHLMVSDMEVIDITCSSYITT